MGDPDHRQRAEQGGFRCVPDLFAEIDYGHVPLPEQLEQGSSMICPRPRQRGQVVWTRKKPWAWTTWPRPSPTP